jgi:Ni,Fe-hydrogenase III large subunit
VAEQFAILTENLAHMSAFRDRLQWVGILTRRQAVALGVTGLVARASGVRRDFRLQHPVGVYQDQQIRQWVQQGLTPDADSITNLSVTAGDSLARFLVRHREVYMSAQIIEYILDQFGLGYVEGWRGDIIYWLMQDKFGRIYRCKVRDPSMLNWRGLKAAVDPHELDDEYRTCHKPPDRRAETLEGIW